MGHPVSPNLYGGGAVTTSMGDRLLFECTRCNHIAFSLAGPPRCASCGSRTGVIKALAAETAFQMILDRQQNILTGSQQPRERPE
jgi:hypothetical protein